MTINANTKIASLLKNNADALEAIVSISSRFSKLRNPILRKVIAGRTSIAMASRMGDCTVDDFFNKLEPLGFTIDRTVSAIEEPVDTDLLPGFLKNKAALLMEELDVRPIIESGKDPLSNIMEKIKELKEGMVLKIVNSFEPTPLIHLLGKQGFESYVEHINEDWIVTYFHKKTKTIVDPAINMTTASQGWEEIQQRYHGKLETVDVRMLEMPLPMHTILGALETLPDDKALFVYHKRIPVFLLPELDERKLSYRIKEIDQANVQLLIYKDDHDTQ